MQSSSKDMIWYDTIPPLKSIRGQSWHCAKKYLGAKRLFCFWAGSYATLKLRPCMYVLPPDSRVLVLSPLDELSCLSLGREAGAARRGAAPLQGTKRTNDGLTTNDPSTHILFVCETF